MQGTLSTYTKRLVVFESDPHAKSILLFVGGLGDQFLAVPYLPPLASTLASVGWSLGQVMLASSPAWGLSSIQEDADCLRDCLLYLNHREKRRIVILGHSTGCQDCIELLRRCDIASNVHGVILQAPVSDREAMQDRIGAQRLTKLLAIADELIGSGNGALPMLQCADLYPGQAVSALRFRSLNAVGGDEDFFSSDLPVDQLRSIFAALSATPVLFVIGADDEYMPAEIDKSALLRRFLQACPSAHRSSLVLRGANHSIDAGEAADTFTSCIKSFLNGL